MEFRFAKVDPAGNVTALVLDPVPACLYERVARKLMAPGLVCAEQVGFVEAPRSRDAISRLQMMGGEFCGNACLAFGAWLALERSTGDAMSGGIVEIPIEISGHDGVLNVAVQAKQKGAPVQAWALMPLPKSIQAFQFKGNDAFLVDFPGIRHAVVWGLTQSAQTYRDLAACLDADDFPAFGVMFVSGDLQFVPAVGVAGTESLVWEGSCASGSIAVAAAIVRKFRRSPGTVRLKQPRGELAVTLSPDGHPESARVLGLVRVVAQGTASF